MAKPSGKFASCKRRWTDMSGKGLSELETAVQPFARVADLSLDDAILIVETPENHGQDSEKAANFVDAVEATYGEFDVFRMTHGLVDYGEPDSIESPA